MSLPDKSPPAWRMPFAYLGLVSLGLAQPLFGTVGLFRREFQMELFDVLAIVLFFQFAVTGILILLRWILKKPGLQKALDILIIIGATLTVIRQVQLHYLKTEGMTNDVKLLILGALLAVALVAVVFIRRYMLTAAAYYGLASPVFGIFFVFTMLTHPLPLNLGGEPDQPKTDKPAVMLVIMDELALPLLETDNREIDAATYPNFAKLAARATWYPNAITNHPTSSISFPSFLTSKYDYGYDPAFADNLEKLPAKNMFSIFQNAGYSVHVYSDYFGCAGQHYFCESYLSGRESHFLLKTFLKFVEEFGPDFIVDWFFPGIHGHRVLHQHEKWMQATATARPGEIYMVHLMASHAPYVFNEDGSFRHSRDLRMAVGVNFERALVNYRAQLKFFDGVVGDFLAAYDSRPADNPLMVLIVSDHGNCWSQACPGRVQPGRIRTVMPSLTGVPAFLMVPGQPARIDRDDFQLIDIPPTLLAAVGLDQAALGDEVDGAPRLTTPPPARKRLFYLTLDKPPVEIPLPNDVVKVE